MQNTLSTVLKHLGNPFILAAITASGYVVAYRFWAGYLEYFGIPEQFVDLSIDKIIVAITLSLVGAYTVYYLIDEILYSTLKEKKTFLL